MLCSWDLVWDHVTCIAFCVGFTYNVRCSWDLVWEHVTCIAFCVALRRGRVTSLLLNFRIYTFIRVTWVVCVTRLVTRVVRTQCVARASNVRLSGKWQGDKLEGEHLLSASSCFPLRTTKFPMRVWNMSFLVLIHNRNLTSASNTATCFWSRRGCLAASISNPVRFLFVVREQEI